MSELRQNPFKKNWVVISENRAKRPDAFRKKKEEEKVDIKNCPFCPGNEEMTPPEIFSLKDDKGKWQVRVVPNKFEAFRSEKTLSFREDEFYTSMNGAGSHEVVITRSHESFLAEMNEEEIQDVVNVLQNRYQNLSKGKFTRYIQIIENHGREAGASIIHPHFQIFAIPLIPDTILREMESSETYFKEYKRCIYCDVIKKEQKLKERIIAENEEFIALCPFASKSPFEIQIIPKTHQPFFEDIDHATKESLARILKTALSKLDKGFDNPDYNAYLHTTPHVLKDKTYYHFHYQVLPRFSIWAGFEMATQVIINTVSPERAASFLRGVKV